MRTHNAEVLAGIDGQCAINSALQVDLAGHVNAEGADGRGISLPGGLPDFAGGASRARISIVALRASFGKGRASNIVARVDEGVPVTILPSAVDFVVTEYGIAPLRGVSDQDRAAALIAVAHPDYREFLRHEFASMKRTESVR
ncbi:MAG: acetyl-CoA hydrolase/transferase C-terminal domain-containing protein [Pseudomonadota bacterium]